VMEHTEKGGASKFKHRCTLPLTGARAVDLLITDLGVFDIDRKAGKVTLIELAPDVTLEEIKAKTEAHYSVALKSV
jgi:3-oxoacid CoA-transferase subunit B